MDSPLIYPFFIRALAAGVMLGAVTAFLGCFVVIRRMAFFSDAIAHASLTGIALGLLLGLQPVVGALVVAVIVGIAIANLGRRKEISVDTAIGVLFSVALAIGVLLFRGLKGFRGDLLGYLFGDILAIDRFDVITVVILGVIVAIVGFFLLKDMIFSSLNREMAEVQGVNTKFVEYVFMVLLAVIIAVGIKLVGVILIGALMIIPVATAKRAAHSFFGVLVGSIALGVLSVIIGIFASFWLDSPTGPTIVLTGALFFFGSFLLPTRS